MRTLGWKPGRLASGAVYGTMWQLVRALLQAATIVVLAHTLGAVGYGALSGVVALYTVLAQLVGSGTAVALLRDAAHHGEELAARWVASTRIFLISGVGLAVVASGSAWWLLRDQMAVEAILLLALAELIATPLLMPSAYWLLTHDRSPACNAVLALPAFARLLAALSLFCTHSASITLYASIDTVLIVGAAWLVWRRVRPPGIPLEAGQAVPLLAATRRGAPYVVGITAATANSEIDKTLLLRLLGPVEAGIYSAAFRVAQAATIPVNALVVALLPRLFRSSRETAYFRRALLYVLVAGGYGCVAAAAVWLFAPYAGWLLGRDFGDSGLILKWLSLYVVSNSARQVVMAVLTGGGKQWLRSAMEGGAMLLAIAANLIAIPRFGWQAAAATAIAIDLLMIVGGLALMRFGQRSPA